jgi:hypothetical protein
VNIPPPQPRTITPVSITKIKEGKINVEDSKVSIRALEIETKYRNALVTARNLIISRINVFKNLDISSIVRDFTDFIDDINRGSIEAFYTPGATYVSESNKK